MAEIQLYFIGTSRIKEIRAGGSVTYQWGNYSSWRNFKSPIASSSKKVAYNKTTKNKVGTSKYGGVGGVTKLGSVIPATATRIISGVSRTCEVRYYQRGYTRYTRTAALKRSKKMKKTVYTSSKPYQYRLQYKDKPVVTTSYSSYANGIDYIYFADHYYQNGAQIQTNGHLLHPVECEVTYFDVRRNFDSNTNNSDDRDNKGSYVLKNVRSNVVELKLAWEGLPGDEGADLLDTLNPEKDSTGQYNYLTVQYRDLATNKVKNKTFFASERNASKFPDGHFKRIEVTLTEV